MSSKVSLYYCNHNEQYVFVLPIWHGHPIDYWDNCMRKLNLYSIRLFNMISDDEVNSEVFVDSITVES